MDTCVVCGSTEIDRKCDVCGAPLCTLHVKQVEIIDDAPGQMVRPGVSMSVVRPGAVIKKVCPKCMKEVDFI